MQISWFEIIAQIVNFFVLLFILQKLFYKPVTNAMEERQERIHKAETQADEKMNKAEELIDEYDKKIANVDEEKREILENARQEAKDKKESLLENYREEAENKRKAYLKEIEDEKEVFINNLRRNLGQSAVKIASYILDTISSNRLEAEVFNSFIENLKDLRENIPDKQILDEEEHLDIISSKNLSDKERQTIEDVLNKQMKNLKEVNYEVDESLVLGYELSLETYTVHTNIKNYLDNIEDDIIKNLETNWYEVL